jgi:transposase InsO family protein
MQAIALKRLRSFASWMLAVKARGPHLAHDWPTRGPVFVLQGSAASRQQASPSRPTSAKRAWRDNVFVERVWKSVKYEEVYLKAYANVPEARASIGKYLDFYNRKRPHQSLRRQTPDQAYFNVLQPIPVAA